MKNKIIVFTFLGYIFCLTLLQIVLADKGISATERRTLKQFPKFELSNQYITKLDEYFLDQFPFRDEFRSIKANFNFKILHKLDNNGIYLDGDYIFKSEYPTNKESIKAFKDKINNLDELLLTDNNKVYMVIVPDKNYYLENNNFLQIDYDYIYDEMYELDYNHIDIRDILSLKDYYYTDTHWKQENIIKVVEELDKTMNFGYQKLNYNKNTFDKFYGVYYGESAMKRDPETIVYLTNSILNKAYVEYLENEELHTIYSLDKLESNDAYEVFLDGASSLITITNENSLTDKELIIFRDSFGSSITPLLVPYYSKITVIDNRYMSSQYIKENVEFNDQDVLFLYSTLIVNNSGSLKG